MTTTRRFQPEDLLRFNNVNLDKYTETYNQAFYLQYLAQWPEYFACSDAPDGRMMGYVMGKAEGRQRNWHGHVTAVTVAPESRRLGLAGKLMHFLEDVSENIPDGYFVDLYVRISNLAAINMYKKLGYVIYRQVIGYYSGTEDAYDMRKALPRDGPGKASETPLDPLRVEPGVGAPSGD